MCLLTALPFPVTNKIYIHRSVILVAQFLQYELCGIKAVLDRLTAEQIVYARTRAYPRVPSCTCLYTSVASSSDNYDNYV